MSIEVGKPYSCHSGDEELELLGCRTTASWASLGLAQLWSFMVWLVMMVIAHIASKWWNSSGIHAQPAWTIHYVGTRTTEPVDVRPDAFFRAGQLTFSTITVIIWIQKSYMLHETSVHFNYEMEIIASCFFICHHFFSLLRNGFSTSYVTSFEGWLDCFTITPLLLQHADPMFGGTWLTISYLRVYRIWTAFTKLGRAGVLEPWLSDFNIVLITKIIECVCVIVIIAGTMWIIEGLGDIPGFFDNYIDAGMGKISFFQMCYFSFITISTVGYGDFAPTTIPGRCFILVATIGGVTFFSIVSMEFVELQRLESSGGGKYRPSRERGQIGHILLIGGGVDSGAASVIEIFLQALCRDESTPDIILLGASPCTEDVRAVIKDLNKKKFFVKYFQGTPMSTHDLHRVRADIVKFVYILADFNTTNPLIEDESNVLRTGAIARYNSKLNYRLMLVDGKELELAMQVGLNPHGCYALSELKASLLAGTLRSPGLSTLILNLCLPNIPPPDLYASKISPWLEEYIQGAELEVYGFSPHEKYYGLTFREASEAIAMGCNVIVFAAQVEGVMRINPAKHIVNEYSILFAISSDDDAVDICAFNNEADKSTWTHILNDNRIRAKLKASQAPGFFNEAHMDRDIGNTSWLAKALSKIKNENINQDKGDDEEVDNDEDSFANEQHEGIQNEGNEKKRESSKLDIDKDIGNQSSGKGFWTSVAGKTKGLENINKSLEKKTVGGFGERTTGNGRMRTSTFFPRMSNSRTSGRPAWLLGNMATPLSSFKVSGAVGPSLKENEEENDRLEKAAKLWHDQTFLPPSRKNNRANMGGSGGNIYQYDDDDYTSNKVKRGLGPLPSIGKLTKRSNRMPLSPTKNNLQQHDSATFSVQRQGRMSSDTTASFGNNTQRSFANSVVNEKHNEKLAQVVASGGHTILCVLGSGEEAIQGWKIVEIMVGIIFSTHSTPVVVVAQPSAKLSSMSNQFLLQPNGESLFLLEGDPKRMATLLDAGVETCEQFVTLAPTSPPSSNEKSGNITLDGAMMDRENLLACSVLEHHLERWNRTDLSPMYDWFHPDAIKFMSPPPAAKHVLMQSSVTNTFLLKTSEFGEKVRRGNITTKSPDKDDVRKGTKVDVSGSASNSSSDGSKEKRKSRRGSLLGTKPPPSPPSAGKLAWEKVGNIFNSSTSLKARLKIHPGIMNDLVDGLPNLLPGDMEFARKENRGHYRFAAGRVLPKPAIAALFSMAYYTPGILELIEALINPTKTEQTSLIWVAPVPLSHAGRPYTDLCRHFYDEGTIPIGLLRGSSGPLPYVVAKLPSSQTIVDASDAIYFVASYQWAEYNLLNYFDQALNGGQFPDSSSATPSPARHNNAGKRGTNAAAQKFRDSLKVKENGKSEQQVCGADVQSEDRNQDKEVAVCDSIHITDEKDPFQVEREVLQTNDTIKDEERKESESACVLATGLGFTPAKSIDIEHVSSAELGPLHIPSKKM